MRIDVTNEGKLAVLAEKLGLWQRTYYSDTIDQRIARQLKDESMEKAVIEGMRRSVAALDIIEEEIAGIEKELEGRNDNVDDA